MTCTVADLLADGAELKTGPFGTLLAASEYATDGVPVVSVGEIGDGDLVISDRTRRVGSIVTERLPEYLLEEDDIVFARKGSVERTARVRRSQHGWFLGSDGLRLRVGSSADPAFVAFQLRSPASRDWLLQHAGGSTLASLNQETIARLPLRLPPLATQRAIAEVLGALDDKIAANSRLSSAADGLAAVLAKQALHSASMLGDVADLVMGTSPTGATMNETGEGVPFFQGVRDFGIRVPKTRVFTVAPIRVAARGDVLLSVRAPVGQVNRADRELCIGRGLAAARSKTPATLLHALRQATVWDSFNGEGTVFGSINRMDLRRAQIPWSSQSGVVSLERTLTPLEARIDQAEAESTRLAELRDTLLPHLMSGRISVRDAEKAVEEVL